MWIVAAPCVEIGDVLSRRRLNNPAAYRWHVRHRATYISVTACFARFHSTDTYATCGIGVSCHRYWFGRHIGHNQTTNGHRISATYVISGVERVCVAQPFDTPQD